MHRLGPCRAQDCRGRSPRSEIILAEQPARSVRLAAANLQESIEKISGARLPIVTRPTGNAVKIFIGASAVLSVQSISGQPIAKLASYGLHSVGRIE